MNLSALVPVLVQMLLALCLILMGAWGGFPWLGMAGLALSSFSPMLARLAELRPRKSNGHWQLGAAWTGTLLAWGSVLLATRIWDNCYALMAWLAAGTVFLAENRGMEAAVKLCWRALAMIWALAGGWFWLADAYLRNERGAFFVGILINVLLLFLCRFSLALGAFGKHAVHTLILLLLGIPAADLMVRHPSAAAADPRQQYYSYEKGSRDIVSFEGWKTAITAQFDHLARDSYVSDPSGRLPFRLRPGSQTTFFQAQVHINRLGFRGAEVPLEKGRTYRIVTIGESTTFGAGFTPEDQIWPARLEQLIRERIKPARPVMVINAGVPSYDLKHNLTRLADEILPLQPDLIICYHGFNGFYLIGRALPRTSAKDPPQLKPRPLRLLAEAEYGLKVRLFKHRLFAEPANNPPLRIEPAHTEYAAAYRQLIAFASTNHIRLALADFSMAVNAASDPGVIDFYRRSAFAVDRQIKANEVHTLLLRQLAAEHPEVGLIDTHPGLDGAHDKFIDLVHFTPEGERQMAESMFGGIQKVLAVDLAR